MIKIYLQKTALLTQQIDTTEKNYDKTHPSDNKQTEKQTIKK